MKKEYRAQGWFLTYPRCTLTKEEVKEALVTDQVKEYIIAREEHKDGTPHIHVFLKYEKKVTWNERRWDIGEFHGNYEGAKSWRAVEKYITKDGDYIGNISVENARKKQTKILLTKTPKQAVDDGDITLMQLPQLIKAKAAYMLLEEALDMQNVRGIWYYGKPGIGKSHSVRSAEPSLYIKAQNKWWDGYLGEEAVLIDDFDRGGSCLGHYLKVWADKWKCTGEIKGSTIPLNFQRLYITSNYRPCDLFKDDDEMLQAIERRF